MRQRVSIFFELYVRALFSMTAFSFHNMFIYMFTIRFILCLFHFRLTFRMFSTIFLPFFVRGVFRYCSTSNVSFFVECLLCHFSSQQRREQLTNGIVSPTLSFKEHTTRLPFQFGSHRLQALDAMCLTSTATRSNPKPNLESQS